MGPDPESTQPTQDETSNRRGPSPEMTRQEVQHFAETQDQIFGLVMELPEAASWPEPGLNFSKQFPENALVNVGSQVLPSLKEDWQGAFLMLLGGDQSPEWVKKLGSEATSMLYFGGIHTDKQTREQVGHRRESGELKEYELSTEYLFDKTGKGVKISTIPLTLNDPRPDVLTHLDRVAGKPRPTKGVVSEMEPEDYELAGSTLTQMKMKLEAAKQKFGLNP